MSMAEESQSDQARYAELFRMLRPEYPFVQLGYHFGENAAPTSRTMRVVRHGIHLVKKEYLGQLSEKTEHEVGLLLAAATKGLRRTASFKAVYAPTRILGRSETPALELLMRNYGLDLEDWLFLFLHGGLEQAVCPYFHLSIWRHVLRSMWELHQANFVQVDVKADNICVALPQVVAVPAPNRPGRIALTFDLREMTLIDLGEALHPNPNKRSLLFHPNGIPLGPANSYISPHYIRHKMMVRPNDMKPLRSLDWRIDFFALGCMVSQWNSRVDFPTFPPTCLTLDERRNYSAAIELLHLLPEWLKSKDTDPSTEAGDLPHSALIEKIEEILPARKWQALQLSLPCDIGVTPVSIARFRGRSAQDIGPTHASQNASDAASASHETCLKEPEAMSEQGLRPDAVLSHSGSASKNRELLTASKNRVEVLNQYRLGTGQQGSLRPSIDFYC
ncbi:MAG TPA: hypothetical protein VF472_24225 [Burkholderiaceae bacterium]